MSSDFAVSAELGYMSAYNNYQPVLVWPSMSKLSHTSYEGLLSYEAEAQLGPRDHQYVTQIASFFMSLVLN
jgi:hypothetical protein